jgi:hypothetical protein
MIPGNINTDLISGAEGGGYTIERSLRFNSSDSAYCGRNFTSAGNQKKWTWAGWVKRSTLSSGYQTLFSAGSGGGRLLFGFGSGDTFSFELQGVGSHATTAVFRDPSAWYHVVVAFDTTQATAADRTKVWINNTLQALSGLTFSQNTDYAINSSVDHRIGCQTSSVADFFNGYLADIHFIDGQALDPSSFVETSAVTGQLLPRQYTGSFGTNGFWLKFSDNSASTATTLGKDYSGNSNNWSPTNLSVTAGAGNDSLVDVPTNGSEVDTGSGGQVRGNYCTWNPLDANSSLTISNGNLELTNTNSTARNVRGTIAFPSSGKWYYEITPGGSVQGAVGIGSSAVPLNVQNAASQVIYFEDGSKGVDASRTTYGASYSSGTVIGVAFDADSNQVTFYKNNVSQGAIGTTAGVQYFPFVMSFNATYVANFGQRPFAYTAPSGFKALCDTSLPAPVVAKPSTVMDVKLYTGNGSTQTISGLGFSPDLVWIKQRSAVRSNWLTDTVRGNTKLLSSDQTAAEITETDCITAFNSDGFSLDADAGFNASAGTYAAWCWDAGSTTVTNTQGSITSQVRTNGYLSIVTYTGNSTVGATVGHGLGVAPQLIIIKGRNNVSGGYWQVYHQALGNTKYLELNSTTAANTSSNRWNNTTPSSTVFTLGSDSDLNGSLNYVAYCFAPVAGYSSFGSYTGNGSTDGPFVFTGMRTRWVLIKNTGAGGNVWVIYDTARDTYNIAGTELYPNLASAEAAGTAALDIVSNGFKIRTTSGGLNASGATYIYAAFAESPFAYSRAR